MDIVRVDPDSRLLTEDEVLRLLGEPNLVRLGLVDADGWPVVYPLWFLHDQGRILMSSGADSRKVRLARDNPRAFFCVDVAMGGGQAPRGVRGRADVAVVTDDLQLATDVMRRLLLKYMGTLTGDMPRTFLESAQAGETAVLVLTPRFYGAWGY